MTVHGEIEIGDRWNPLRLVATKLDVLATESDHATRRPELLEQLNASGAPNRNRALRLPTAFSRIGLVTPANGNAGRADFVDRLALNPTPIVAIERRVAMSGPAAPEAIAVALHELSGLDVDAVVVCRGGGATADLAAFDAPVVANAIVHSRRPVVIAVGHATDRTIADEMAHTSLPTPTAAADWIVSRTVAASTATRERTLAVATTSATERAHCAEQAAQRERARAEVDRRRARIAATAAVAMAVLVIVVLVAQRLT